MIFKKCNDKPKLEKKQSAKAIGNWAEQLALDYLLVRGLKLVDKQYRCHFGECDLVMQQSNEIVFVEVRYKKTTDFCHPIDTISSHKQKRLLKTAEYFLLRNPTFDCRMDVITITGVKPHKITWIPDAFGVQ